jgi:hypothetical protein
MKTPTQEELDAHWGYVYKITNLIDGTAYIGKHKHKKGEAFRSYLGGGTTLQPAQRLLGHQAFEKEIVWFAESESELIRREQEYITRLMVSGAAYYNYEQPTSVPERKRAYYQEQQEVNRKRENTVRSLDYIPKVIDPYTGDKLPPYKYVSIDSGETVTVYKKIGGSETVNHWSFGERFATLEEFWEAWGDYLLAMDEIELAYADRFQIRVGAPGLLTGSLFDHAYMASV